MSSLLNEFLEKLAKTKMQSEAIQLLRQYFSHLGFNIFAYQGENIVDMEQQIPVYFTTYPMQWVDYYVKEEYYGIDPVPVQGRHSTTPFFWGDEIYLKKLNNKQKLLFKEAAKFGIFQGYSIPMHGKGSEFAMITFSSDTHVNRFKTKINTHKNDLHIASIYFHETIRSQLAANLNNQSNLTPRETECLQWMAAGKKYKEIAELLGIKKSTVIFHSQNIKQKLGVSSIQELVAKTIKQGIIKT